MRKFICSLILILTLIPGIIKATPIDTVTYYYVDGANGNDSNNGKTVTSAFKTIKKAKDTVRTINKGMNGDIVVYIKGGTYYLGEENGSLVFNHDDSGYNGHKVMYANYNGEKVSIVGGKRITGWTKDSGNIYKAYVGTNLKFYELFENNTRSVMARTPNEGYFQIEAPVSGNQTQFHFKSGDFVRNTSDDYADLQVSVLTGIDYGTKVIPVSSIDWNNRILSLSYSMNENLTAGKRYFLRGAKSLLDNPGEFYLDESTGYLYYYPREFPIENQTIVIPTMLTAINLSGNSNKDLVENLEFRGLDISVSNFSKAYADGVGNVRYGLVSFTNAANNTFIDCIIRNSGYSGVTMNTYTQYNKIIDCTIENTGHHGIYLIGEGLGLGNYSSPAESYHNKYNVISGNKISNTGINLDDGSGISISQSGDNEISYNQISNTTRSGINLMGRTYSMFKDQTYYGVKVTYENHWDFLHTRNNVIKFNDISNALTNTQDGGGIYSWGTGKGNVFDNNRIHDFTSPISGGETFGIYFDDYSDYNIAKNNIIYGVGEGSGGTSCPVYIKGVYNVFTNNIIADNKAKTTHDIIFRAYGGEPNHHATVTKNIIYKEGGQHYYYFYDWSGDKVEQSDYNTFYHPSGSDGVKLNGAKNWDYWKTVNNGMYDKNSIIADPLFKDRANHDYTVLEGSPALNRGFVNINQREIGIFKNAEKIIQAENYDNMMGVSTSGNLLNLCDNNDWAYYKNIDFGSGVHTFYAKLSTDEQFNGGTVELRLDSKTGPLVGSLVISKTTEQIVKTTVTGVSGKHDLYLVFKGNTVCNLDWFNFATVYVSDALEALNSASTDDMEEIILNSEGYLGLVLDSYKTLSPDEKNIVHTTLKEQKYTTAEAVQEAFNQVIASIKPASVPVIVKHPESLTRNIGESATFSVIATINGNGTLSYQWQKSTDKGNTWTDIDGATSSSYTIAEMSQSDNLTRYRCVVTNSVNDTKETVISNTAVLSFNTSEAYLLTVKNYIKNETFEQIPEGTTVNANNGKTNYNASATNPLWMTTWGNPGTNNVQKIIALDGSKVLETYRNSGNNNLVTLYDSTATPYADRPITTDNIVISFRFKCDSAGSGSTSGRFRLMINGTTPATNYLAQYVNSADTGPHSNRVSILNGLVYTQALARDQWHHIQIHINTENEHDKKLVAVYADDVLVPDSVNKSIPDTFTGLTKFSTNPNQKIQLFTGDGVIRVFIDDLMIFEPNAPVFATNHKLTYSDGTVLSGVLTKGQTIKASALVTNNTYKEKNARIIIAAYKDESLTKAVSNEITLQPGDENIPITKELVITENLQGAEIRTFVWESFSSLKPLTVPIKYPQ